MTHYHNNYALVQCIDPTTYKVRQEDPQQLEVDGEWIDLLPYWRWEMVGVLLPTNESSCREFVEEVLPTEVLPEERYQQLAHMYYAKTVNDLLRSLNLDPARCLVFKQMEK